jgi:hypothetical protein
VIPLAKYDIPNTYISEYTQYQTLFLLGSSRTTSGSGSWTSSTSSVVYNYTSGEEELFNTLKTTLQNYMITASDWNNISSTTGGTVASYTGTTTILSATPTNTVNISSIITSYDYTSDLLFVYLNSTHLQEGTDYDKSGNTIIKTSGNWGTVNNAVLDFVVLKNISSTPTSTFSGSLITDGTVNINKLDETTQSLINLNTQTISYTGSTIILSSTPTNTVDITELISSYDYTADTLIVFQNSIILELDSDYTISLNTIVKSYDTWGDGQDDYLYFFVLKNVVSTPNTYFRSMTYNPPSLTHNTQTTTTLTVNGCELGDFVSVSFNLDLQGILLSAYVSSADTVTVVFCNNTGTTINLVSGVLKVRTFKT